MNKLDWDKEENGYRTSLVINADGPIKINEVIYTDLWSTLYLLVASMNLSLLEIDRQGVSTTYQYKLVSLDGREWAQTIVIPPLPAEATMTFDVVDAWKVSEFSPGRAVRDILIKLIRENGIHKIKYTRQDM